MNSPTQNILEQLKILVVRPMHPDGTAWVAGAAAFTLLALLSGWDMAGTFALLTFALYVIFRDPARVSPQLEGLVAAPADGILTKLEDATWPSWSEQGGDARRFVIQTRIYDVHVLRSPMQGTVTHMEHMPGQWGSNVFDKTAQGNERLSITLDVGGGQRAVLDIVAGALPQRIHPSAQVGDAVTLGQPLAYAAFGAQVELFLPNDMELVAQTGQHMVAGETPIAAALSLVSANNAPSNDDVAVLPNSAGWAENL